MGARDFSVNIVGLSNKVHHFEFEAGNDFFERYGGALITEGTLMTKVALDKRETFIEAGFEIEGWITLVCDRCLEPFRQTVKISKKLHFKYGDADEEITDEMVMIHRDREKLALGQYIYEFAALEVPMKKLHPRFRDEAWDDEEGKIIYRSASEEENGTGDHDDTDPRWEILRKLK